MNQEPNQESSQESSQKEESVFDLALPKSEKNILEKLRGESDPFEAMKLAKRLTGPVLIRYAQETWPHKNFPDKIKKYELIDKLNHIFTSTGTKAAAASEEAETKIPGANSDSDDEWIVDSDPFIVEIRQIKQHIEVANAVTERFKPIPINRLMTIPELIGLSKKLLIKERLKIDDEKDESDNSEKIIESSPKQEPKNDQAYDDSGPIESWQLDELIQLKNALNIESDSWFRHVEYFLDAEGHRQKSAQKLTKNQGDTFITKLKMEQSNIISNSDDDSDDDGIPF